MSSEAFEAFLTWLNPEREEAGRKYEDIRRRLIKIFAGRGCFCPEDLADETINRVIVKVPEVRESYRGDPGRYFGGVARNVYHEFTRKRAVIPPPSIDVRADSQEQDLNCLDECLERVPESSRVTILRYYEGEKRTKIKNRNEMARELGTDLNALRIRVHRIRALLQQCVGDCLARKSP